MRWSCLKTRVNDYYGSPAGLPVGSNGTFSIPILRIMLAWMTPLTNSLSGSRLGVDALVAIRLRCYTRVACFRGLVA